MPKIADPLQHLSPEKRLKVEELEKKCNDILDKLLNDPGNEKLSRELRETEVKIVALTGEAVMDYPISSLN